MQQPTWYLPLSVQIHSTDVTSEVAVYDSINVDHRNNLEDISTEQLLDLLFGRCELLQ